MRERKNPLGNWKMRRVAFLVSDAYHAVTPVSIMMPVRVKERTVDGTVFEGPINAVWERRVGPRLNVNAKRHLNVEYDLVGVLVASDVTLEEGRIGWLAQSATESVEDGADMVVPYAD